MRLAFAVLLQEIVLVTIATGCQENSTNASPADAALDGGPPLGSFTEFCPAGQTIALFDALRPGVAVDYLALRSVTQLADAGAGSNLQAMTLAERGTACANASDMPACQAKFEQIMNARPPCGPQTCTDTFYVFTRGDEVGRPDIRTLAAPIETPQEAAAVTFTGRTQLDCSGYAYRSGGQSIELTWMAPRCSSGSDTDITRHDATVDVATGAVAFRQDGSMRDCPVAGRRHEQLVDLDDERGSLGAFFARQAYYEAASVTSFRRLAEELRFYGAPPSLVGAALSAARDEIRHARIAARLARRFGATRVPKVAPVRFARRPLRAIAEENAVEGCVHESHAALLAGHQAALATDPDVRDAMRDIADDEARHAELAWAVAHWLEAQLDPDGRNAVEAAREEAFVSLSTSIGSTPSALELFTRGGLPRPAAERELAARFRNAVQSTTIIMPSPRLGGVSTEPHDPA
jgi:hypothetical protein